MIGPILTISRQKYKIFPSTLALKCFYDVKYSWMMFICYICIVKSNGRCSLHKFNVRICKRIVRSTAVQPIRKLNQWFKDARNSSRNKFIKNKRGRETRCKIILSGNYENWLDSRFPKVLPSLILSPLQHKWNNWSHQCSFNSTNWK